jgi:hypothetical protein
MSPSDTKCNGFLCASARNYGVIGVFGRCGKFFGSVRRLENGLTTVSETEVAVETMVAVRNKVIEAYQSIMAMPI